MKKSILNSFVNGIYNMFKYEPAQRLSKPVSPSVTPEDPQEGATYKNVLEGHWEPSEEYSVVVNTDMDKDGEKPTLILTTYMNTKTGEVKVIPVSKLLFSKQIGDEWITSIDEDYC